MASIISNIHPKIFESDLADVDRGRFFSKEDVEFIQQYFTEHPLELGTTFEKGAELALDNGEKLVLKHRLIINEEGDIFACNRMDEENLLGEGTYGKVGLAQNIDTGELVAFKEQTLKLDKSESDPNKSYRERVDYALGELAIDAVQGLGIGTPIIEESEPHDDPSTKIISMMKLGTAILEKVDDDYVMMQRMVEALWDLKTHFHDKNMIHRDIKNLNMMFVDGKLRIIDYGMSIRLNRAIQVEAQEKNKEQSRIVREKDAKGRNLIFYRSARYGWGDDAIDTEYDLWPPESQLATKGKIFSKSGDIYSMGQVFGRYMELSESFNDDIDALIDKMKDPDPYKRPTVEEALVEAYKIIDKMELARGIPLTSKTVPVAPKVEADGSIKVKLKPSEKRKRLKNLVSTQRLKLELKGDLIKFHNALEELVAATQGNTIVELNDKILNFEFDPKIIENLEKFRKLDPNSIVVKRFDFYIADLEAIKKGAKRQYEEYLAKIEEEFLNEKTLQAQLIPVIPKPKTEDEKEMKEELKLKIAKASDAGEKEKIPGAKVLDAAENHEIPPLTPGFDTVRSKTQDAIKLKEEQEIQTPRTSPPTSPRK